MPCWSELRARRREVAAFHESTLATLSRTLRTSQLQRYMEWIS